MSKRDWFEVYDEETNKTLFIMAYDLKQAESISENVNYYDYKEGDSIDILDDINNPEQERINRKV